MSMQVRLMYAQVDLKYLTLIIMMACMHALLPAAATA